MTDYIRVEDCEDNHFYYIAARNFEYGVYNKQEKAFIGIRNKHDQDYLDMEWHWDTGAPFGTATPLKHLGYCPLSDLRVGWTDPYCTLHHRVWTKIDNPTGDIWNPTIRVHLDDHSPLDVADDFPKWINNEPLHEWIAAKQNSLKITNS